MDSPLLVTVKQSDDPAAGDEITFVADEDCIVYSLRFTFVTSAVAGNRNPALVADDGTNQFFRVNDNTARAASTTSEYCFYAGSSSVSINQGFPLPDGGLRLREGDRIRTITAGLDAGDNYSAMTLQVDRW